MSREAARRLASALERAGRGDLGSARVEARRALAEAPGSAAVALVAAPILFVTRDYHESLALLDRASAQGAGPAAQWRRYQEATRLGWDLDARQALAQGAAAQPSEPRWRAALLALHARRRDHDAALAHGEALLAVAPRAPSALVEMAAIHAARGEVDEARGRLGAALGASDSDALRLEAARLYRAVGSFAEADALLSALRGTGLGAEACLMQAELALWRGEPALAEALAREAGGAAGARVRGAALALQGQRQQARERFDEALRLDPRESEAHAWLGELATDDGRYEDAHAEVSRAVASAKGPLFVGHLLRLRINLREPGSPTALFEGLIDFLLPPLRALAPELAPALAQGDKAAWGQVIERCLAAMSGNRSVTPTWRIDGALARLPAGPEPRAESRRALERIRVAPPEILLAELAELARRFPRSGLPHAHRGELLLWLGRVAEARRALEAALGVVLGTRWAHIGLTLCDILEGDPEKALTTSARGVSIMHDTEGPAVFVHRGEALRRLGRLDEASVDLERSIALHPGRVGAWVNVGLLRLRQGRVNEARQAVEALFRLAPGLLSDAARAAGVELFPTTSTLADETFGAVLDQALTMLRGNRSSSCPTYFTAEGALRFGPYGGHTHEHPHDDDAARLAQASALLRRSLPAAASAPASAAGPRPHRPSTLSDEQVRSFVERGYLVLRGALPRALIDAWVGGAKERLLRDPARSIKRPHGASAIDLDDPRTWAYERVDVAGEHTAPMEQASPALWGAVCDLLGGSDRVQTRTLSDYFILKFPFPDGDPANEPWHIDDPRRAMTLRGLTHGLVGFALFSDVAPDGGPSLLLPGSVPHVARLLASRPEGVDLVDPALAGEIAERSGEEVRCAGAAGDVFLAHGLIVHRASRNRGDRVRWLSNPMIHLREPLDPFRADPALRSPVEEALARALPR